MCESDVRERILVQALRLFSQRGYGSTSVREVVAAAGVTKPALYYYFDSKEALFREVIDGQMAIMEEITEQFVTSKESITVRLKAFFMLYLVGGAEDLDALRLMLTCWMPTDKEPRVDVVSRHLTQLVPFEHHIATAIQEGVFAPHVNPKAATIALFGAANLHLMAALSGVKPTEDTVDELLEMWLGGVK